MGADFLSKTRDRVQKSWRASFADRMEGLPYPDSPVDREVLRASLREVTQLAVGNRVLLRLTDASTIEVIDGLQVIGHCDAVPTGILEQLQNDDGLAAGSVVAKGQLLSTLDVEIEPANLEAPNDGWKSDADGSAPYRTL